MRTVQQIFKAVIKNGIYDNVHTRYYSPYMCIALFSAERGKIITRAEHLKAKKEIHKYLRHLNHYQGSRYDCLEFALMKNNIPCEFEDREQIYLNWSKRPMVPA